MDSKGEPQHFVMGVRGVHHGLVGGDVRMGKTNLLHVLISQLALAYRPEELELYLLDFKEVEFDAYLTERLPHARAITSRTDREFGLSMLRRFHDEIDRRARLCREAKVTDLPDYRLATGQVLPRALVIMDEFQVLFSEEDRLAREAARLLADIAKRGAAFGLHLLLATQSPGGPLAAYLRPVYEQMALRIALGCTQPSVSQAILGEGNDAATRLVRAGDAIYNDRRGEGANPVMRIAMLPTRERLKLIADIRALGAGREYPPPASFDPDATADFVPGPTGPGGLARLGRSRARRARVAGRGNRDQARHHGDVRALHPVQPAHRGQRGTRPRSAAGHLAQRRGPVLPGPRPLHRRRVHPALVAVSRFLRPAGEPAARGADRRPPDGRGGAGRSHRRPGRPAGRLRRGGAQPERFFLIAGMHRWHELLAEGDYGRPSEISGRLVRLADKGPDAGIHVVAWTDGYTTAERALRRAGIGFFGLRAVLRVLSPAESDSLLGVSAAASLDDDRALFRDTEWPAEQVEKFKPYSTASLYAFAQERFGGNGPSMTEQERAIPRHATSPTCPSGRRSSQPSSPTGCWPATRNERASWPRSARTCSSSPGNC